jgi:hypothetical protein
MSRTSNILIILACALAVAATLIATYHPAGKTAMLEPKETAAAPPLPPITELHVDASGSGIARKIQLKTHTQGDVSYQIKEYTLHPGDSMRSIAQEFDLEPETILW